MYVETQKLDKFKHSNFKLDQTLAQKFVFKENSNSIKLEILELFGTKPGKLVSKLELKLKKWNILELVACSNSKF